MARMDRLDGNYDGRMWAHFLTPHKINPTCYNSDITNPPLRVILSGQENTLFHDGRLRRVNSFCRNNNGIRTFYRPWYVVNSLFATASPKPTPPWSPCQPYTRISFLYTLQRRELPLRILDSNHSIWEPPVWNGTFPRVSSLPLSIFAFQIRSTTSFYSPQRFDFILSRVGVSKLTCPTL